MIYASRAESHGLTPMARADASDACRFTTHDERGASDPAENSRYRTIQLFGAFNPKACASFSRICIATSITAGS